MTRRLRLVGEQAPELVTLPRPRCHYCRAQVDRYQPSRGVVCAYPCGCWHAPDQAKAVVIAWRVGRSTATEPHAGSEDR